MFNRFQHLLNKGIISEKDLQGASEITRKFNQSIETILNRRFLIPKAFIGRSLSLHFNCDFIAFDPEMPIATEMFQGLNRTMLLKYGWVPISWGEDGIVVLVDDPFDFVKRAGIETAFEFLPVIYAVGIKEDIEAIIGLSFDQFEANRLYFDSEFAQGLLDETKIVDNMLICL